MIMVVAKNYVKKSAVEKFKALAAELATETRKEKGCMEYALYKQSDKKTVFGFIEKWETRDSLEKHFESAHFKRMVPLLKKCCRKPGTVDCYEPEEIRSVPEKTASAAGKKASPKKSARKTVRKKAKPVIAPPAPSEI
ncbi:MAG: putative quinol monooxygenase [Kiritimatiellae bacterium]|nr:putative quinol monooxygenase [Kiritimatiellia bacterium]